MILNVIIAFAFSSIIGTMYAILEGIREGYYYHSAIVSNDVEKYNLHSLFWIQRVVILLSITSLLGFLSQSALITSAFIISSILGFSFWHNGMYYITRNNLNPEKYKKRFKDASSTSSSLMEFSYNERLFYFTLSIILDISLLILYIFLNL